MLGPAAEEELQGNFQHDLRGVIPRTFDYLFSVIDRERAVVNCLVISQILDLIISFYLL